MTNIITRFAPSPTGNLHVGSARTALINFIVSQQNQNSKFYLELKILIKKDQDLNLQKIFLMD